MTDFRPGTTAAGKPCKRCVKMGERCPQHRESHEAESRPDRKRCDARRTDGSGNRCRNPAGFKTEHVGYGRCHLHGGCTPQSTKHSQREMADEAVATYGLPREIGPHEALLEEVHRTAGHVVWLEQIIREQDPDALVWGRSKETEGGQFGGSTEYRAGATVWLELYRSERRHLKDICKTAIACGIAERQVQIAEEHGRLLVRAIEATLDKLGVDRSDDDVRRAVGESLRVIDGGKAA